MDGRRQGRGVVVGLNFILAVALAWCGLWSCSNLMSRPGEGGRARERMSMGSAIFQRGTSEMYPVEKGRPAPVLLLLGGYLFYLLTLWILASLQRSNCYGNIQQPVFVFQQRL